MANGLFAGIMTPEQADATRRQSLFEQARATARLSPDEQASMLAIQSGQRIGGLFSDFLGYENPDMKKAREFQEAASRIKSRMPEQDLMNPAKVYAEMAKEASSLGYTKEALEFVSQAQQEEANQANIAFKNAQAQRMLNPPPSKPVQIDLGDRIQLRDPVTNQVIETIRKGLNPAQQAKIAEQQAQEQPGFIGKTGAYRNKFGEVIPATEMAKQRQGFVQAQDLLAKLNKIDYNVVKKAESVFDYTEPGFTKSVGTQVSPSTVDAQVKIAAAQLLEQINKLPPGSASDADMRAAVRDFPGYGSATNLANWVNDTKSILSDSLSRQNELYGFPIQVKPTPKIGPQKKEQQPASTWRIIETN